MTEREMLHLKIVARKVLGKSRSEIAKELGITPRQVSRIWDDPYRSKQKALKAKYKKPCIDCGKLCGHVYPGDPPRRCQACQNIQSRTLENRREKAVARKNHQRKYTDKQCLDAIRSIAVDGVANGAVYDRARRRRKSMPSRPTIVVRWGSWRNAVHAAGLEIPNEGVREVYANRRSEDETLQALIALRQKLGHWPSARTYDEERCHPTPLILRQRFGTWTNAIEAAMKMIGESEAA